MKAPRFRQKRKAKFPASLRGRTKEERTTKRAEKPVVRMAEKMFGTAEEMPQEITIAGVKIARTEIIKITETTGKVARIEIIRKMQAAAAAHRARRMIRKAL